MNFGINPDLLSDNPETIKKNVLSRITLLESFALLFLFFLILLFSTHHSRGFYIPWDYERSYLLAGRGDFSNFFYGYWITPLFWVLEKIPRPISYILWATINVICTFFASRVLGGKAWTAVFSYQMMYVVFYGQITGFILGALGLAWWGFASKKAHLAGLGLLLASTKPQLGFVIGFILWIMAELPWKEKIKTLVIPILGFGLTTIIYPNFIKNIITIINQGKVGYSGNFSLWQYIGPWSLALFIPPLAMKLAKHKRVLFLVIASLLSVPYLQQTGLLTLYIFPLGWLPVFGNLGFLFPLLSWGIIRFLIIIPLVIYGVMIFQELRPNTARDNRRG